MEAEKVQLQKHKIFQQGGKISMGENNLSQRKQGCFMVSLFTNDLKLGNRHRVLEPPRRRKIQEVEKPRGEG
jgi:hypothetical protein